MVKDGDDWHGFQTNNLKNLSLIFQDAQMRHSSFNLKLGKLVEPWIDIGKGGIETW